ncbi:hypothetical protein EVAR_94219_1 [Eumeta japonica]|uniref:Uncharacterized protein n=1 Tax=Eumeta variegata TaxID=151549 RepID=A0A4C1UN25_EUMVA|nr:hypothetical protein EVAR_94219_1 [Eumeta japonica]
MCRRPCPQPQDVKLLLEGWREFSKIHTDTASRGFFIAIDIAERSVRRRRAGPGGAAAGARPSAAPPRSGPLGAVRRLTQCRSIDGVKCSAAAHMDEVRLPDWPEPGPNVWLPAYGFHHDIMDKEDYFNANGRVSAQNTGYWLQLSAYDVIREREIVAHALSDKYAGRITLKDKKPLSQPWDIVLRAPNDPTMYAAHLFHFERERCPITGARGAVGRRVP